MTVWPDLQHLGAWWSGTEMQPDPSEGSSALAQPDQKSASWTITSYTGCYTQHLPGASRNHGWEGALHLELNKQTIQYKYKVIQHKLHSISIKNKDLPFLHVKYYFNCYIISINLFYYNGFCELGWEVGIFCFPFFFFPPFEKLSLSIFSIFISIKMHSLFCNFLTAQMEFKPLGTYK